MGFICALPFTSYMILDNHSPPGFNCSICKKTHGISKIFPRGYQENDLAQEKMLGAVSDVSVHQNHRELAKI